MLTKYKFHILNSDGSSSSTVVDFDDVFVSNRTWTEKNLYVWSQLYNTNSPKYLSSNWANIYITARLPNLFVFSGIKTDGTLWTSGYNLYGQLGLGDIVDRSSTVQVGSLNNWKSVSAGILHTLAIKTDGTLWSWGYNINGQLGLGNVTNRSSPVQVGSLTNWKQVSNDFDFSLAVKTDGTLWAWGNNIYGNLGLGDQNDRSSPVQVGTLTNWKQVSVGQSTVSAIKTDGTLWSWGFRSNNQGTSDFVDRSSPVQVGTMTNWKQVSVGQYHVLAVKTDGTLWAWGSTNFYGQLGLGHTFNINSPVQVGTLTNWKQVSASEYRSFAVKTDGTLWSWGYNFDGELGLGDVANRSSPVQVGSLSTWNSVYQCAAINLSNIA